MGKFFSVFTVNIHGPQVYFGDHQVLSLAPAPAGPHQLDDLGVRRQEETALLLFRPEEEHAFASLVANRKFLPAAEEAAVSSCRVAAA